MLVCDGAAAPLVALHQATTRIEPVDRRLQQDAEVSELRVPAALGFGGIAFEHSPHAMKRRPILAGGGRAGNARLWSRQGGVRLAHETMGVVHAKEEVV